MSKCVTCGKEIGDKFGRKRCADCRKALARYGSQYARGYKRRSGETLDAYILRRAAETAQKKRAKEAANAGGRQCPYCGKRFSTGHTVYCKVCRDNGFHHVHALTGRTNGWDKPQRAPRAKPSHGREVVNAEIYPDPIFFRR